MSTRAAAVAGMFYPRDPQVLDAAISRYLTDATMALHGSSVARDAQIKALIVPHAGYQYSAPIAATAYSRVAAFASRITRVVLLGPAHRVHLRGMAIPTVDRFEVPGGAIDLDQNAIALLKSLPGVVESDLAHRDEHCLEVQLPFLRAVLHDFKLVPVVVGACPRERVAAVLEALWGGDETLIVISSDLSHYLPYSQAQAHDARTSHAIVNRSQVLTGEDACGAYALNGLMEVARRHDLHVTALDVRNSGDTAGDKSRVVGYGAYIVS
ncbi:MAG: AmmeMemoRadiSam system protein B [Gammaproteobacteria bacterium]|nr:AmmeMemoRadiSam system protein B [Gammaproteobacteria bacterium]